MTLTWAAAALVIGVASFVMGLTGFGIALVAMAFLPWLMPVATAIIVLTIYALVFSLMVMVQLRHDITPRALVDLLVGTLAGTPLGVWLLASLPAAALNRLIGLVLITVVILEARRALPHLAGRGWGLTAGFVAGVIGGAVGTPGPPVVVYATTQRWPPRTLKANLMTFFAVNQAVILVGYWWAGLLTASVLVATAVFAIPALAGAAAGIALFGRLDAVVFRKLVFALLLLSGLLLAVFG